MKEDKSIQFRIEFNQNIIDSTSSEFSKYTSERLMKKKVLLFEQWGTNFCEGFFDIVNYIEEINPVIFFFKIIENSNYSEKIKNIIVTIEEKGLDYKIIKINKLPIEIQVNSPDQGGLTIYYNLTTEEEKEYLKSGIQCLKERIKDMKEKHSKYKIVSWR